jgi:hypothetical protein
MTLSLRTRATRCALAFAVAVSCAASAAGTVSAGPSSSARPDDRSGIRGASTATAWTQTERITENSAGQRQSMNAGARLDPAIARAILAQHHSTPVVERISEHSLGQNATVRSAVAIESPSTATSFDWTDAGIGAGATLVFFILAMAAALVFHRGRQRAVQA